MKNILEKGGNWAKRAVVTRIGRNTMKRGGILGVGIGAAAGLAYLAYNYAKNHRHDQAQPTAINKVSPSEKGEGPVATGEKKIVI